jgi:phosphoglycerate dehydrogenase-like enzyme
VTDRSKVVVMGAAADRRPPGIEVVEPAVDLAYASSVDEMAVELPGADVVLAWRPRSALLEPVWDRAADVRWIQSASAGVEELLFPAVVNGDVAVTNARGVFDQAIAEYVLGLLLTFAKGFPAVVDRQRRREWRPRDSELLADKRLLVVGVGSIGRAVGRACAALGMVVRGVATTARPGDAVFGVVYGVGELMDACAWADVVVSALPGTPQTRGVFDDPVFASMQPTARFVNVGRGSAVDEDALVRALREGRLAGAALDVFEREPLRDDSPLWDLPNVIVSPHMSGSFAGWRERLVELFVANLERYLTGRPLENVVDKQRGYVPS